MDEIKINKNLLNKIIEKESAKLVGKCMKRFEISEDKDEIKKQIKEILYESMRDVMDLIIACSMANEPIHLTKSKEKNDGTN